jgi:hypothetical protein
MIERKVYEEFMVQLKMTFENQGMTRNLLNYTNEADVVEVIKVGCL